MPRRAFFLPLAAALACARPAPPADYVLRVGVVGPIGEVGPLASSGGATLAGDVVFEPLASPRPGGWSSRFLARWERLGPRRWRLELLPGVRFSDGQEVGPEDLARALRPQGIDVATSGPGQLEVETRAGGGPIEVALALGVVARRSGERWLGTGPFAVVSQDASRVVLRRVQPAPGRIATLELVSHDSGREAFAQLLKGQLNGLFPVDRAQAELLEGVPGVRLVRGSAPTALVVRFGPGLGPEERRALAAWMPSGAIAAAVRRDGSAVRGEHPALPAGPVLRVGHPRSAELGRAALALRQALGPRGGEIAALGIDEWARRAPEFDLFVGTILVRPPGVGALYFGTGAPYNWSGFSDPAYDAALAASDEQAAEEALRRDPPAVVVARRERLAALDARLPQAALGNWGAFETLPDWEVAP